MISYIKGELTEIMEDAIVVENNGIGFNIRVPATVISEFCVTGEQVKVYTYLQIREDAHSLYGFLTRDDLEIFKMLINVNGIQERNIKTCKPHIYYNGNFKIRILEFKLTVEFFSVIFGAE